jgi:hypothetical protein
MLSCASIRAVELGPLRGPLVLGPPTNHLSPSFRRCSGTLNWPPAGTTNWPLTCVPSQLIDPENANRSRSADTRRIPLIVCAGEPHMTGVEVLEQRTVGETTRLRCPRPSCNRHRTASSRNTSGSPPQRRGPADRRGATRPGCSAGRARSAARSPDPSPGTATRSPQRTNLVASWRGRPQHDLTSTRHPVSAHKRLVQSSGLDMFPSDASSDTRVKADDLGATDDPLARLFPLPQGARCHLDGPNTRKAPYAGNFASMVRSSV